jgi:hypothetical protein
LRYSRAWPDARATTLRRCSLEGGMSGGSAGAIGEYFSDKDLQIGSPGEVVSGRDLGSVVINNMLLNQ